MLFLILRLEAPLMAFGAPIVDNLNVIHRFPGLGMLTGMLGNALGWDHREGVLLDALQSRLRFASRVDREGKRITDFQTVEISGADAGWTTRGRAEGRAGGEGTYVAPHLRFRDYWANSIVTVALTLAGDDAPTLDDLARALEEPERPLFIGRKPCLPSRPVFAGYYEAADPLDALRTLPRIDTAGELRAQWPDGLSHADARGEFRLICDRRDWVNQVHTGERRVWEGLLRLSPGAEGAAS